MLPTDMHLRMPCASMHSMPADNPDLPAWQQELQIPGKSVSQTEGRGGACLEVCCTPVGTGALLTGACSLPSTPAPTVNALMWAGGGDGTKLGPRASDGSFDLSDRAVRIAIWAGCSLDSPAAWSFLKRTAVRAASS